MIKIPINIPGKEYEIYIERGLIKNAASVIRKVVPCKNVVVITDENVNKLYAPSLMDGLAKEGYNANIVVLPAGESTKSMSSLEYLYNKFIDYSLNRDSLLIALGGGVIGDLTGFAAATFLRGISYVQIPTSITAQVDSSIGGKVAVDLKRGKNLVGNFYHPKLVVMDPEVLSTLEERFFSDGMAEVIKYALIRDRELFNRLLSWNRMQLSNNLEYVLSTCCNIKKQIVEKDEKDKGERMLLNFGHTIGHAVEKYYDYKKFSHGEAVAIGMYNIALIGEHLGLTEKGTNVHVKELINKYSLPFELKDMDIDVLVDTMSGDKKVLDNGLNFIFISEIGKSFIKAIDTSIIRKSLKSKEG
ncbi:3-dehydroquinate synthase [Clostridium oryzae]|uniref:3-dehydroquinate synthase n=1 Tax=Clostridium oryzae TaxID=1450648 RepID=A0A1V4IBL9_9CLOT|nr:3-dehydroquinate synthase [Clostridium oryzae]OPJ57398.1 3-dehydroquinate synthase [Clostridium oryzae]